MGSVFSILNCMSSEFATHNEPIWRSRANFLIAAKIEKSEGLSKQWEQLWTRQIADNRFEICCIPFFIYDLALGDRVETSSQEDKQYILKRVYRRSAHYTFRVWFGQSPNPSIREEIVEWAEAQMNCSLEWYSRNLLALDVPNRNLARMVADILSAKEQREHLVYETGRTK